ncbi:MAG: tetratricopeptide repeat protein [Gemmatimonadota bacterium]
MRFVVARRFVLVSGSGVELRPLRGLARLRLKSLLGSCRTGPRSSRARFFCDLDSLGVVLPLPFGHKPQRGDVADRSDKWRAVFWMLIPSFGIVMVLSRRFPLLDRSALLQGATICLVAWLMGSALQWITARAAHHAIHTLLAGGGEPRAPEYSAQETLLIRGQVADAIASFHSYIAHHPEDLDARIRLAQVLAREGGDAEAAEAMFLEVRIVGATLRQDVSVSNGLIDLYHASGRRAELKAELARFARQHQGTLEGRNAHERLRRMVSEDGDTPGR